MIGFTKGLGLYIIQGFISFEEVTERVSAYINAFHRMRKEGKSSGEILKVFYLLVDEYVRIDLLEDKDVKISCKKGCAYCCKINVDISPIEAKLLVDFSKDNHIAIDKSYLEKQKNIPKNEIHLNKNLSSCVFLKADNTCSVYDVRPFACRLYNVITPADKCDIQRYPTFTVGTMLDIEGEIISTAIVNISKRFDSLPKMVLEQLN